MVDSILDMDIWGLTELNPAQYLKIIETLSEKELVFLAVKLHKIIAIYRERVKDLTDKQSKILESNYWNASMYSLVKHAGKLEDGLQIACMIVIALENLILYGTEVDFNAARRQYRQGYDNFDNWNRLCWHLYSVFNIRLTGDMIHDLQALGLSSRQENSNFSCVAEYTPDSRIALSRVRKELITVTQQRDSLLIELEAAKQRINSLERSLVELSFTKNGSNL